MWDDNFSMFNNKYIRMWYFKLKNFIVEMKSLCIGSIINGPYYQFWACKYIFLLIRT